MDAEKGHIIGGEARKASDKVLHSYSIVETSAFPCRVSACQRTAWKGFR